MNSRSFSSQGRQSGAALYVALMMLILMALIGIVALQVASLQERMSANYMATGIAFQKAEAVARAQEASLKANVMGGLSPATNVAPTNCTATHNAQAWTGDDPYVRRLDLCFAWGSLDVPSDESERTDQIFQITAYSPDRSLFPSSESVVDTVFIP